MSALSVVAVTSPAQWEAAQRIRFTVFVDEQRVPAELELDAYDAEARHWLALDGDQAVGTARAVAKGDQWKIGRVAVLAAARGSGAGSALMRTIETAAREAGVKGLFLESQVHAIPFYERLGYAAEGPEFDDAGIPHRLMRATV